MTMIIVACVGAAILAYRITARFIAPAPEGAAVAPRPPGPNPSNAPSLFDLARVTNGVGPDGGSDALDTNDAVQVLNHGTELLTQGKLVDAVRLYQRALTLNPEDEEAHFNLGVAFSKLGRVADLAKHTNDAAAFFNEAVRHYDEALRLFPDHAEAHNNLGNLLLERRRYEEATAHYSAAIRINPDQSSAINNLGKCLALQGKTEEALLQFHEAVRLNTNYVEARFNLANACILLGQLDEAVNQLEQVLRLAPDFELGARRLADAKAKKAAAGK